MDIGEATKARSTRMSQQTLSIQISHSWLAAGDGGEKEGRRGEREKENQNKKGIG
jgi:hypothetical protein